MVRGDHQLKRRVLTVVAVMRCAATMIEALAYDDPGAAAARLNGDIAELAAEAARLVAARARR